jgi:hypothetical protein
MCRAARAPTACTSGRASSAKPGGHGRSRASRRRGRGSSCLGGSVLGDSGGGAIRLVSSAVLGDFLLDAEAAGVVGAVVVAG